ncbi:hypothetical protein [Streptomyces sp. NK15101]|uniref:hypothetical protein n=1 Tax=Streptomyces sp. NK15101 TaxID=2873261 RepID=UPI0027DEB390|nr:hypothetical protein [Streptomyces sp. NK15101]
MDGIEGAAHGLGPWQRAHNWLVVAARRPFTSGADNHPFYGAPALAHVLACAADGLPGAYERDLDLLDRQVLTDVRVRLDAAGSDVASQRTLLSVESRAGRKNTAIVTPCGRASGNSCNGSVTAAS